MVFLTLDDIFQRFVQKPSKRRYTIPNDEDHVYKKWRTAFLTVGSVYLKHTTQNPLSNAASDNQRSPNMTLHLNNKHVLFQVERSEEVLEKDFLLTTKETSPAELKKTFLERTQRRFGKILFCSRNKTVFISIRYHKTSQKQDVKNQSTKRSHRSLAQPKSDSGFEQKTRIVPSREISGSSQNRFFSYNQRKKQSRAQTDNFETYSTSFWNVCVFLLVK